MKHYGIIGLLSLVFWSACSTREDYGVTMDEGMHLTLTVNSQRKDTRALGNTEDENENRIEHLDCFLYPLESDENHPAVVRLSRDFSGEQSVTRVETSLNAADIEALYPRGADQCKVYAIANLPEDVALPDGLPSVRDLKKLVIATESFEGKQAQPHFVMDNSGEERGTLDRREETLSGTINLVRAAAKISLTITSIKEVKETDAEGRTIVWTAYPDGMQVFMNRGVKRTHVDAGRYPYTVELDDYYNTRHDCAMGYHTVKVELPGGGESKIWEQDQPFYSYASDWRAEPAVSPYLILVVPWQKSGEGHNDFYNCYYQISINSDGGQFLRNHYYKIHLSVSTLGSFVEEKPKVLEPGFVVLDWNTNTVDARLEHFRYLMVVHDNVVLNNRERVEIPNFTSHPVKLTQVRCTRPNLSRNIVTVDKVNPDRYTLKLDDKCIVFEHELNNNYRADDFDFTPYTLTFNICHTDQENYFQKVKITQYPAIYAEADMNSDYRHDGYSNNDNRHHGYTFVNGYYTDYYHYGLDRQDYFCSAPGYVNRKGSPNMYVFTISSVEGTDYVIGDPREKEISDIVDDRVQYKGYSYRSAWVEAPSFADGIVNASKRRLQYYYATDDSRATRNMIAPKFRVASAYAVLSTNDYPARKLDAMKKRCASYQEDGYPAGRWRLPTQAEFQFIMSQVDKRMMPELYLRGSSYWCAHGLGIPQGNGKIKMNYVNSAYYGSSTRCVYDEWYWEDRLDDDQKKHFTWGDKQR